MTLKYSSHTNQHIKQEEEQNWIQLSFSNSNENDSSRVKDNLYCKKQNDVVKLDISNEEFILKLVDSNYSSTEVNKVEKI